MKEQCVMMPQLISEKLASYLSGDLSSGDLELWLVSNLQEILDSRDQRATELANGIDVAFIRWNVDELDDQDLTTELARLYDESRVLSHASQSQA